MPLQSQDPLGIRMRPVTGIVTYISATLLTANVAEVVFAANTNLRGIFVWQMQFQTGNLTATPKAAYLYKVGSAPVDNQDGTAVLISDGIGAVGTTFVTHASCFIPFFVPALRGLWYNTNITETFAYRSVLYTFL